MLTIDFQLILDGNRRALAKAITLVESQLAIHQLQAQELLEQLLPLTGNSIRVGISGSPGVGKSTFIEALGQHLISLGKKVAVLAVDPSSPVAGGSILGDKTRMEQLAREPNAYIRPSPSSGALGGVAQTTRETMLLCEAAGFNVVLVETVGVGQSECEVAGMVDFFLVLMQPSAGDELQGIKKGIVELADALVINKADGDLVPFADQAKNHYQQALSLLARSSFWQTAVLTCSALHKTKINSVWALVEEYCQQAVNENTFEQKRNQQNIEWMELLYKQLLEAKMSQRKQHEQMKANLIKQILGGTITPLKAAHLLYSFDEPN